MRPIYEEEENRQDQEAIIKQFCDKYGVAYEEMPPLYSYDFQIVDVFDIRAIAEVKRRFVNSDAYPDIILSKKKVDEAYKEGVGLKVPLLFVVGFNDGVKWAKVIPGSFHVRKGGRKDRGDPQDIEDVYCIPLSCFRDV